MQRHSAFRLNLLGCDLPSASILAGPFLAKGPLLPTGLLLARGLLVVVGLLAIGLLIGTSANVAAAEPIDVANSGRPGTHVAPFKLTAINLELETDTETAIVELEEKPAEAFTVVCFLGTECPLARLYAPRLNLLASEYAPHNVRIIGINSNRHDGLDDVRAYVRDHRITFPIGKDYQNIVADQFGARRTPEVFVIDASRTIRYRGRIDDQYKPGLTRANATRHDLRRASRRTVGRSRCKPAGHRT